MRPSERLLRSASRGKLASPASNATCCARPARAARYPGASASRKTPCRPRCPVTFSTRSSRCPPSSTCTLDRTARALASCWRPCKHFFSVTKPNFYCIYRDEESLYTTPRSSSFPSHCGHGFSGTYIFFYFVQGRTLGQAGIDLYRRLATRLFLLLGSDRTGLGPGLLGRPFFETNHLDGRRALFWRDTIFERYQMGADLGKTLRQWKERFKVFRAEV